MRTLILAFVLAGCSDTALPKATNTVCPDPDPLTITYENFGAKFMSDYCTICHDKALARSQRNGAPIYHDFDTLAGVMQTWSHIDAQTGFGPDARNELMPPERCPSEPGGALSRDCRRPTDDERTKLAEWLACEKDRPHI